MPRISKDPGERKQEILDAAVSVFYEKGYENTKMSDIAIKLNVSEGLCYRYFPSKEALFDSAVEHYAVTLTNNMKRSICDSDKSLPLKKRLEKIDYIALEKQNEQYFHVFHSEKNTKMHQQLFLRVCEMIQPYIADLIKKAHENGRTDITDFDTAASFITYGQLGICGDNTLSGAEKSEKVRAFLLYIFRQE